MMVCCNLESEIKMPVLEYTVRREPLGIVIRGSVPVLELSVLLDSFDDQDFEYCDGTLAEMLGATLVVTTVQDGEKWMNALRREKMKAVEDEAGETVEEKWVRSAECVVFEAVSRC